MGVNTPRLWCNPTWRPPSFPISLPNKWPFWPGRIGKVVNCGAYGATLVPAAASVSPAVAGRSAAAPVEGPAWDSWADSCSAIIAASIDELKTRVAGFVDSFAFAMLQQFGIKLRSCIFEDGSGFWVPK